MNKPMTDEQLEAIKRRCEKATPEPWAWEQYGEKENCFHIGVALDKNENQLCGRVETERYDEDADIFVEDVLWRTAIGDMEGAIVNYADADFIAHARTDVPVLVEEMGRLREENERLTDEKWELDKEAEKLLDEVTSTKIDLDRARELLEEGAVFPYNHDWIARVKKIRTFLDGEE